MKQNKLNNVFSYGTLQEKFPKIENEKAIFIGMYTIDRSGMFPRMVKSNNIEVIEGKLLKLTNLELEEADRYEGYPDFYTRVKKKVKLDDGLIATAWVYL